MRSERRQRVRSVSLVPQSTLPSEGGDQTVDRTASVAASRGLRNASTLVPMLTVLTAGTVVAFLYFARDVIIPITLGILLSFLLAPAVRWVRRLRAGRVPAVMLTVLAAFLAIFGFAAVVVHETTTLAQELPEYGYNLETKVRSLPGSMPGNGAFHRVAGMFRDLRNELTKSQTDSSASPNRQPLSASSGEPAKPVPVEIRQPELQPLQLVESIIEPLLQPLAMAGLVVVFAIMILLERRICGIACFASRVAICTELPSRWTTRRRGSAAICFGNSSSMLAAACRSALVW